jgi:hypothetical protein
MPSANFGCQGVRVASRRHRIRFRGRAGRLVPLPVRPGVLLPSRRAFVNPGALFPPPPGGVALVLMPDADDELAGGAVRAPCRRGPAAPAPGRRRHGPRGRPAGRPAATASRISWKASRGRSASPSARWPP